MTADSSRVIPNFSVIESRHAVFMSMSTRCKRTARIVLLSIIDTPGASGHSIAAMTLASGRIRRLLAPWIVIESNQVLRAGIEVCTRLGEGVGSDVSPL